MMPNDQMTEALIRVLDNTKDYDDHCVMLTKAALKVHQDRDVAIQWVASKLEPWVRDQADEYGFDNPLAEQLLDAAIELVDWTIVCSHYYYRVTEANA